MLIPAIMETSMALVIERSRRIPIPRITLPQQLIPAMQTITDSYAYDAYGNLLGHSGATDHPLPICGRVGILPG